MQYNTIHTAYIRLSPFLARMWCENSDFPPDNFRDVSWLLVLVQNGQNRVVLGLQKPNIQWVMAIQTFTKDVVYQPANERNPWWWKKSCISQPPKRGEWFPPLGRRLCCFATQLNSKHVACTSSLFGPKVWLRFEHVLLIVKHFLMRKKHKGWQYTLQQTNSFSGESFWGKKVLTIWSHGISLILLRVSTGDCHHRSLGYCSVFFKGIPAGHSKAI